MDSTLHPLLVSTRRAIRDHSLSDPHHRILVAVSGGVDSVVLAHVLKSLGYTIGIAHVNFSLRAEASDGDQSFVKHLASDWNVPFYTTTEDTYAYARQEKLSIQVAARELRYAFFERIAEQHHYQKVAIGHHRDDNAETFFINLYRRAGLSGLTGIPMGRGHIIRPLAQATRREVEAYALAHGLSWREDTSNQSDNYLRNKIRHHLLPMTEELMPGFSDALAMVMDNLELSEQLIESVTRATMDRLFYRSDAGDLRCLISDLQELQPLRSWLYYLLKDYGINHEQLQGVFEAVTNRNSGRRFILPEMDIIIDRRELIIIEHASPARDIYLEIDPAAGEVTRPLPMRFDLMEREQLKDLNVPPHEALFDMDKLSLPLGLRPWREGDRIQPFGMKGSKLISDILIDARISIPDKSRVWVLLSGDEIIWVAGLRSSERFRICNDTKRILKVSLI